LFVGEFNFSFGTVKSRMFAFAECSMSFSDSKLLLNGHSMFDCPLASHTSPTSTSFTCIVVCWPPTFPVPALDTINVAAGPGFNFFNLTIQRPFFAIVETRWP
jgi:hypothetical protein